ncbi:nitroreductase family protein [Methylomonas montana]|uniref:nitroreductase family protein n=1 Tax=Methylomonas montana TaxID=3058963 RepID=UPI00265962B0|nr:nitroreductase family protein [Methylomonas montana]WKJ89567.1 nitroreductase family protein [Methylomonas montana]
MNKELINKILEAAIRAPSGDNVQPWRFQVSEDFTRIDLYNLPEKDDSYYNFEQAASYIAHGALLENILIAAGHMGIAVRYQLFPDDLEPDLVVRMDLTGALPQPDPLYHSIFNRRTNRFPFRRVDVTEQSLEKLKESVKCLDNISISLINQKDKINALAKILMVNDRLVFERKDLHGFLFDKIRWNMEQVDETRDGLPVETLGLNPIEKVFFPLMRFWRVVKIANLFGLSRIIGLKCWWNCRNASVLAMISSAGNDKFAFVQGGRAVQRLWLEATNQGLEMQPIIGLPLLIHRLIQTKVLNFGDKHRQMIERTRISLIDQSSISETETLISSFRIGYGSARTIETKRRNLDS